MKTNLRLIKSFSILCASAVLIYLAVANALYGQNLSGGVESRHASCGAQAKAPQEYRQAVPQKAEPKISGSSAPPAQFISPAEVYAVMCERAEEKKPWTEPTPLPGNVNRKIEKPFNVTVR